MIGYTLSLMRDDHGETVGAALFFKDLTHVEQMEERERLRDRLAALGEMAAAMAHEIKNPLAGIEVMAGSAAPPGARQPRRAGAGQGHHQRSEDGQRHRPGDARLRAPGAAAARSRVARPRRCQRVTLADGKAQRGAIYVDIALPADLPPIGGDRTS